jgi:methionine biosynthesis protein MetW
MSIRDDLEIILPWFNPDSRVLDLGCGDGTLLHSLHQSANIEGYGLEIDPGQINACVGRGVNVIEMNIDEGLTRFADKSFDTVVMTQALQVMKQPHVVLDEMLRIGKECIVTFPNFGNWHTRFYLAFKGRMPVTKQLAYQWYDTPNIHFCTVRDFENLCAEKGIRVLHREFIAERSVGRQVKGVWPNLFSETAIYHLTV